MLNRYGNGKTFGHFYYFECNDSDPTFEWPPENVIYITSTCSSGSTHAESLILAKTRANRVKSKIITDTGIREENFKTLCTTKPLEGEVDVVTIEVVNCIPKSFPKEEMETETEPDLLPKVTQQEPRVNIDSVYVFLNRTIREILMVPYVGLVDFDWRSSLYIVNRPWAPDKRDKSSIDQSLSRMHTVYGNIIPKEILDQLAANMADYAGYSSGIKAWNGAAINDTLIFAPVERVSHEVFSQPRIPENLSKKERAIWRRGYECGRGTRPYGYLITHPVFDDDYNYAVVSTDVFFRKTGDIIYPSKYTYIFHREDGVWKKLYILGIESSFTWLAADGIP